MRFFDAHTHTQFAAFANDYREVIERALKNNVFLINVGTQKDTSARAVEIAQEFEQGVYASVGLHPIHTEKSYHDKQELGIMNNELEGDGGFVSREEGFSYEYYKNLAKNPKVVAIGECGLDYYRLEEETKEKQINAFIQQIELAHEVKKPLMVHCRNAFGDLINILQSQISNLKSETPGVIHFFTGTKDDARQFLNLGFSFTFGGVVTFARDYDEAIKFIPLDRILSETDAPYVAPAPYRGKRNEPAYVIEVVKKLAEIKNVSVEEMAEKIFENSKRIFGLV